MCFKARLMDPVLGPRAQRHQGVCFLCMFAVARLLEPFPLIMLHKKAVWV